MSQCLSCNQIVISTCKQLKCVECGGHYHLHCLSKFTNEDYDFIMSSNSIWKCSLCEKNKVLRGDNTPLTPSHDKGILLKQAVSDPESDSSVSGNTGTIKKTVCKHCKKGFAHNAFKATCVKCNSVFHLKCVSTKEEYTKVKSTWQCGLCVQEPTRATLEPVLADKGAAADHVSLSLILIEMQKFRNEVNQNNKAMEESMRKHGEWMVDNGKKIDEAVIKINNVLSEIEMIKQENDILKKTVLDLTAKVDSLEQSARENVIEVQGVPFTKQENLIEVIDKISTAIGFQFNDKMIDKCYRYKSNVNRPGGIVVCFVRYIDMQLFMEKRREKRNLNSKDLGFLQGDASVIYVNSSLTPAKSRLLQAARVCRRERHYTFVWVKNGRIFLRKNVGDPAIEVRNMDDVKNLN